jgi:uncharacterized membrane protein YjgN (DUF898 family)
LLLPALIVWSLRFRARNSAWRGLSFRFDKGAGEAYVPFLLWGLLTSLTMSLLYPIMKQRQQQFVVEGHRFGRKRFSFQGLSGPYYVPYAIAAGSVIGLLVAMFVGAVLATAGGALSKSGLNNGILVAFFAMYAAFFVVMIFLRVRYANLLWNNTSLGAHRFSSTLRARDMMWIYISNLVAIVCTVGLAVPWAMVRLARYRAEHFSVLVSGSLEEFVAASDSRTGAAGAELVDALDVGMEFGI